MEKETQKQTQPLLILGRIRDEKERFRTKSVRIANGFLFNQYQTLQRIELYYNSKFETGEYDDDGFKKYFYNINRQPCDIATKEIDLDTKDLLLRSENGDYLLAEIMGRELKQWMKDQGFAKDLNEYADDAPRYGTVVVKKVPKSKRFYNIDLVNGFIITNQNAKNLNHTNIIEPHLYSFDELRQTAEESGWDKDKVEELISLYSQLGKSDVEVDERYGWVRESELKEGGSPFKMVYTLAIVGGCEETERAADQDEVIERGIVIYHDTVKKHPYKEWHFAKIKKRWLGLGYVETLMDPQMARNESKYYKRRGMLWTSLHIWQTDDENINKNLLLDTKDGDIIKRTKGTDELRPVAMEERNLADYQTEDADWDQNAKNLTFSQDVIAGEKMPSNTPATTTVVTDGNIKRFFDRKREDFALFVKDMLVEDIIPEFIKSNDTEHIFSLMGTYRDRDYFEQIILDRVLVNAFDKYVETNKRVPTAQAWQMLVETEARRISNRPTLDIKLMEGEYRKAKFKLDVVITKENEDTDSVIAGSQLILGLLQSNPAIIMNPMTRPLVLDLAEKLGVRNLRIPNMLMSVMGQPAGQPGMPGMQPGPGVSTPAAPQPGARPMGNPTQQI